jgi:hypothetical protein
MLSARKLLEMRHAAGAIAALLLLVVVAVPILSVAFIAGGLDPFDRFEVIAIEAGQGSGLYTVSYRYHHADSSRDVYAIWVLSDSPPIGSAQPPPGRAESVLVWTNDGDVVAVRWSKGQLAVTAKKDTDRRAGKLSDCYFEYDSAHLVCFDPRVVQVADEVGSR